MRKTIAALAVAALVVAVWALSGCSSELPTEPAAQPALADWDPEAWMPAEPVVAPIFTDEEREVARSEWLRGLEPEGQ